ncbi:PREDICTED: uncharacterized protein LOC104781724 isoform X2 [Camelina sativa]|nr:PREDICTED: uncharacterized protein LOC104781724 isoform X2 [Camelina sativa]
MKEAEDRLTQSIKYYQKTVSEGIGKEFRKAQKAERRATNDEDRARATALVEQYREPVAEVERYILTARAEKLSLIRLKNTKRLLKDLKNSDSAKTSYYRGYRATALLEQYREPAEEVRRYILTARAENTKRLLKDLKISDSAKTTYYSCSWCC